MKSWFDKNDIRARTDGSGGAALSVGLRVHWV